jgi:hypothetical protein
MTTLRRLWIGRFAACLAMLPACHRPPAASDAAPDLAPLTPPTPAELRTFRPIVSADGWQWQHPLPQGNTLLAVCAITPRDVWAAGVGGTLLHFDGTGWSRATSGTRNILRDLACLSPTRIWAVGEGGTILDWDGVRWSAVSSPAPGGSYSAVWASSASDVWVVGLLSSPPPSYTFHFDGKKWSSTKSDANALVSVGGTSATDVWAIGSDLLHFDGSVWRDETPAIAKQPLVLRGIRGTLDGDLWVVGQRGVIMRRASGVWSVLPAPSHEDLFGVAVMPPRDVWAVGGNWLGPGGGVGEVIHFDGTWSKVYSSRTRMLWSISGTSSSDLWTVGTGGSIHHRDGTGWSEVARGSDVWLRAAWGASASDLWAVGNRGWSSDPALLHYDGKLWSERAPDASLSAVGAIWGSSATDIWAVGSTDDDGVILHWNGTSWSRETPPGNRQLSAIWGASATDVWAGGDGVMLHNDGHGWSEVTLPGGVGSIMGLWGSSATDVWGVGDKVIHFDGVAWSLSSMEVPGWTLRAISGCAANDVWTVGSSAESTSVVFHFDGNAWSVAHVVPIGLQSGWLQSILCRARNDVWAVSDIGLVLHFDGSAWSSQDTGTTNPLSAIWAGPDGVWAFGEYGTVLYRADRP